MGADSGMEGQGGGLGDKRRESFVIKPASSLHSKCTQISVLVCSAK